MIERLENILPGKKTLIAVVGLILSGAGGYMTGDLTGFEAAMMVFNGLGLGGLRLAKKG